LPGATSLKIAFFNLYKWLLALKFICLSTFQTIGLSQIIADSFGSIKGIGKITTLYLLVYTGNFIKFSSAKKLASYCGIVPFDHSSGTSIRGKTKVHPMANKRLKKALHMCALISIKQEGEMQTYYNKKVGEGKNKMGVVNAIRNKLVQRAFACVRDQQEYRYNPAA